MDSLEFNDGDDWVNTRYTGEAFAFLAIETCTNRLSISLTTTVSGIAGPTWLDGMRGAMIYYEG